MNPNNETRLHKIERVSRLLRKVCTALLVPSAILPGVAVIMILMGRATSFTSGSQTFALGELDVTKRLVLVTAVLATAAVMIRALCHLRRLFDNYSRREVFTADSARQIRNFGISCILWGLAKVAWAFLPVLVARAAPRSFPLTVDAIFIGAVIVGLSWFAEMAAALREENDLTI